MNSTAYQKRKPLNFDKKLQHSIELLQKSEKLALRYSDKGFYLAFSGGQRQPKPLPRGSISRCKV